MEKPSDFITPQSLRSMPDSCGKRYRDKTLSATPIFRCGSFGDQGIGELQDNRQSRALRQADFREEANSAR